MCDTSASPVATPRDTDQVGRYLQVLALLGRHADMPQCPNCELPAFAKVGGASKDKWCGGAERRQVLLPMQEDANNPPPPDEDLPLSVERACDRYLESLFSLVSGGIFGISCWCGRRGSLLAQGPDHFLFLEGNCGWFEAYWRRRSLTGQSAAGESGGRSAGSCCTTTSTSSCRRRRWARSC